MVCISTGATENPFERLSELGAENGVYYRIQRGVEVAQPQEERYHCVTNDAIIAQRHHQCHYEERQPAYHKGSRYDGQGFGRLPFPLRLEGLFAPRHLGVGIVGAVLAQRQSGGHRPLLCSRRHMTDHRQLHLINQLANLLGSGLGGADGRHRGVRWRVLCPAIDRSCLVVHLADNVRRHCGYLRHGRCGILWWDEKDKERGES